MKKIYAKALQNFIRNPKILFLVDAFGALMTAALLVIVLAPLHEWVGLPLKVVHALAQIAFVLFLYSLICRLFLKKNFKPFLLLIILANSLYCAISLVLMATFFSQLNVFGLLYFLFEMMIIAGVIYTELQVYLGLNKSHV